MANIVDISNIYNHYLTAYSPKEVGRYDTHKKSELRGIYNSIVKINKEAPLSIISSDEETCNFAVGMKENARILHNTIASLGGLDEEELLGQKIAYSEDNSIVSAKFIGESFDDNSANSFKISVSQLAAPQTNTGSMINKSGMALDPGTYSFDIGINRMNYEFQFNINEDENNLDLQNKLSRLINNSNIGISAEVIEEGDKSALKLVSNSTGIAENDSLIFAVSDNNTSKKAGAVDYLGLNIVTGMPQNSKFALNGNEHESYSNHFTVAKTFEITLNSVQEEGAEPISIGLKADTESMTENVDKFVSGYNEFLKAASMYLDKQPKTGFLLGEMNRISSNYKDELAKLGLNLQFDGTIKVDSETLKQNINSDEARDSFAGIRRFTNSVLNKSNQISLNPMNYVQKTIVAYKNPGKEFAAPYITSQYSGMMFNDYC